MRHALLAAAGCCAILLAPPAGTALASGQEDGSRPVNWAQPLELEGVPKLFKVSDDLYRSAQPKAEGMKNLAAFGVETVVNVRMFHSDKRRIRDTDLGYERINIKPWHTNEKKVVRFLQIVTDPERTPVLLHCYKGADRTGMLSAMYRIVVQGWTKEAAIEEMKKGGYGFSPFWGNLPRWIKKADIESIRNQVGISYPSRSESAEFLSAWCRIGIVSARASWIRDERAMGLVP